MSLKVHHEGSSSKTGTSKTNMTSIGKINWVNINSGSSLWADMDLVALTVTDPILTIVMQRRINA